MVEVTDLNTSACRPNVVRRCIDVSNSRKPFELQTPTQIVRQPTNAHHRVREDLSRVR
jgi:hypothetical protein